jgi:fructose-bisphosphate aldolase, class I
MNVYPRIRRMFSADGRCFDVAVDHGFFGEPSFLASIEDIPPVIARLTQAMPDAIQLTIGTAPILQALPQNPKPALVLRVDIANVYGRMLPQVLFSRVIGQAVEQAIRLDAACICVNLLQLPDQPDLLRQCIDNICLLKPECERYGMPMMVEPLVFQPNEKAGGYMVDGSLEKIRTLVRQGVELGADVIKADPCDRIEEYSRVVEVASGCPVLVRGGGRIADAELFERTQTVLAQGAKGIVYGRNVIQHAHPVAFVRALMTLVHDDASIDEANRILSE